jgi:hypothetical protein
VIRALRQDFAGLFGSTGRPGISTLVSWGCAVLAYPLATKGGYAGAVGAAIVFSLSVLFLAYLLGSGALAFVVDAKRSCLPGSQRLARRANLLASALLLPVLALIVAALAGNPVWPAWLPPVLVLATALAGAMASRRPILAMGLFLLVVLTAWWAASGRGAHERGNEWVFLAAATVLLAGTVPLLAAVKWRRVIGVDQRGVLKRALWRASRRNGAWEHQPAVQIVRTCVGGIYVRLSRQLVIGAVLLALFIGAAIGLPWLGASGGRWAVTTLAVAAGGLVLSGFLTQLPNLTRGQIAELALMPGLGAPAAQRRALCGAVLTPPLLWLGLVLAFGSADLLLEREPLSSVGMLAVCLFVLWLTYAVFALQKLAALPAKRQSFISEFLLLYLVVYASGTYYWMYAAHPQLRLWFWFWITPVLWSIAIASAIGFSVRRLATAPHPFLS